MDGRRCTVGSANLDITASYWEDELVLVVEDPATCRAVASRLDQLLADAIRIRDDDPQWRARAAQRPWLRHWPGTLSV